MTQDDWRRTFSDNLSSILQERKMSQYQLARDAGISVSRINDYVNRNATPTIFAIINIAYALDMDVSELVDFGDHIW